MASPFENPRADNTHSAEVDQPSVRLLDAATGEVKINIPLASKVDMSAWTDSTTGDGNVTLSFFSKGGNYNQMEVGLGRSGRHDYEIVQPHNPAEATSKPEGLHHLYLVGQNGNVISESEIKGWVTQQKVGPKNGADGAMEYKWTDTHNMDHRRLLTSEHLIVSEKPLQLK